LHDALVWQPANDWRMINCRAHPGSKQDKTEEDKTKSANIEAGIANSPADVSVE
jgi:hypothetical protein